MKNWKQYISDTWAVWGLFGMAGFLTWVMFK